MFPVVQLGPLAVQVPGLVLLAGIWLGLEAAEREAARLGQDRESLYRLALVGLIAGLVGARLAHVARFPAAYLADPLSLVLPSPATLSASHGILLGLAAAAGFGARRRLPLRLTLDALAPALGIMAAALALANLASGDGFGAPADLPWSIFLWDAYRHPAQVYDLVSAGLVLGFWWRLRDRRPFAGAGFLLVAAMHSGARILLEAFRGDSRLLAGGWRAAQVWGWLALALCLLLAWLWSRAWRQAQAGEAATASLDS